MSYAARSLTAASTCRRLGRRWSVTCSIVVNTDCPTKTDYEEERRSELEVLESIYPDELTIVSEDELKVKVEPETQREDDPYIVQLVIKYTPTYPDEIPQISIEPDTGSFSESELTEITRRVESQARDQLGMAMVYTLSQQLREVLSDVLRERREREQNEANERARLEEEAEAKKTKGTPVTKESFEKWKVAFEREMDELVKRQEQERLKALPLKERDELKKYMTKPTGRELFENATNASLITSDAAFVDDDDDAVEVDYSKYDREAGFNESEGEDEQSRQQVKMGEMSDDD
ncbi:hypothetical protein ACM66B_005276 [Microbotryomycetes sp. NB124-2]